MQEHMADHGILLYLVIKSQKNNQIFLIKTKYEWVYCRNCVVGERLDHSSARLPKWHHVSTETNDWSNPGGNVGVMVRKTHKTGMTGSITAVQRHSNDP